MVTPVGPSVTRQILTRALWFGVIAGLVEGIVPLTQKFAFGRMRIHTSPHIIWMAPLAEAIVFLIVGLALALLARVVMRRSPEKALALATGALAALAGWAVTLLYPQLYEWAALVLALGAGVQAARASRSGGLARLVHATVVPVVVLVCVVALAMVTVPRWRESRLLARLPAAREGAPNVLLLILDTVRAQSLGLYGAANPTTPRLSAMAAEGTVFDYALSTAPWTIPSHASMFTGRYPHELTADWLTPLDDMTPTLAEALSRAGYATGGFVANYLASWEIGFSRGFARFEDYRLDSRQLALGSSIARRLAYVPRLRQLVGRYDAVNRKRAPVINAEFLRWMDGKGGAPFFAFLNYMDAHEMYNPPAPFRGAFGPDTARKNWLTRYGLGGLGYRSAKARMAPSEVAAELSAYEESIAYLDHHVGALMDSLAARGVLDNTVVIVTADHGEHFGEHGRWEHASSLYPQLLHVPLVMRGPGVVPAGRRIPDLVTLRDLAATILAIGPRREELPGRSLARFWDPSGVAAARPESPILSSITNGFWTERSRPDVRRGMRSIVGDGGTLVVEDVKAPATVEYFDLPRDPRGERDLAGDSVRAVHQGALRQLQAVTWRSQSQGVARRAGTIGAPPQP